MKKSVQPLFPLCAALPLQEGEIVLTSQPRGMGLVHCGTEDVRGPDIDVPSLVTPATLGQENPEVVQGLRYLGVSLALCALFDDERLAVLALRL